MLAWYAIAVMGLNGQVRLFYQDKTWVGLKTLSGRKIPARGIKPKDNGDDASKIRRDAWSSDSLDCRMEMDSGCNICSRNLENRY